MNNTITNITPAFTARDSERAAWLDKLTHSPAAYNAQHFGGLTAENTATLCAAIMYQLDNDAETPYGEALLSLVDENLVEYIGNASAFGALLRRRQEADIANTVDALMSDPYARYDASNGYAGGLLTHLEQYIGDEYPDALVDRTGMYQEEAAERQAWEVIDEAESNGLTLRQAVADADQAESSSEELDEMADQLRADIISEAREWFDIFGLPSYPDESARHIVERLAWDIACDNTNRGY